MEQNTTGKHKSTHHSEVKGLICNKRGYLINLLSYQINTVAIFDRVTYSLTLTLKSNIPFFVSNQSTAFEGKFAS